MSDQKALEIAARTVYRNKEGKKVTRSELLAERAREKKVKVRTLYDNRTYYIDTRRIRKGTF